MLQQQCVNGRGNAGVSGVEVDFAGGAAGAGAGVGNSVTDRSAAVGGSPALSGISGSAVVGAVVPEKDIAVRGAVGWALEDEAKGGAKGGVALRAAGGAAGGIGAGVGGAAFGVAAGVAADTCPVERRSERGE
jgi:hypothetical protein